MKWISQFSNSGGQEFVTRVPALRIWCLVNIVSKEWWCYSYVGSPAEPEDVAPPSTHKTSAAAKRQALKNVLRWIDARRAEVLK